jgi:hypothetical protein
MPLSFELNLFWFTSDMDLFFCFTPRRGPLYTEAVHGKLLSKSSLVLKISYGTKDAVILLHPEQRKKK